MGHRKSNNNNLGFLSTSYQNNEKKEKYNAAESRSGHRFMPFILDNFGTVLDETKDMLYQMFLRKEKSFYF